MKSDFIVLRREASPTRDQLWGAPLAGAAGIAAAGPAGRNLTAEVSNVERKQVRQIAAQADTVAVAPVMPMRLIAPVSSEAVVGANAQAAWGRLAVGADTSPFDGDGIVVAVLDTGIDAAHPAFIGVELVQMDFTGEGNGDGHGHGTHCAGIAFGRPVDGVPIGVAPGVKKALIGKVLDSQGSGSSDNIVKAILWAVDQGANVISMSLGMDFPGYVAAMVADGMPADLATARALEGYRANTRLFDSLSALISAHELSAQASIVVAAAGNESKRAVDPEYEVTVSPPAVSLGFLSVGALGQQGSQFAVANFSNTGANVSAPGVNIVSAAAGGGLRAMSGTSMATPCVAGVAALWAQKLTAAGRLNSFQLMSKLAGMASAADMVAGSDPFDFGAGLVRCPQD
ncbi:S8 family serine peptidase [Rugamonas sp. CCM 8940]|uniref:S8 family peptidase n=1 Tax=Rugamonas sp. CCM 8940 TaxID=2765359 RepID=UPI0018F51C4C|nr:S8 family serine peptidase [Rugamonas sp. CCM 8940]MBJ7312495.1 S8 family serine peptidase [Rugamonas sp. CCM 8940]